MRLERGIEAVILVCAVIVAGLWVNRILTNRGALSVPSVIADSLGVRRQVVLVYIGSVDCSASANEDFRKNLRALLSALREEVEDRGQEFYPIGVSLSRDSRAGLRHLLGLGNWAEVSIGGGWLNSFLEKHAWSRGMDASIPELFVYGREVSQTAGPLLVSEGTRVKNLKGPETIEYIVENRQWWRLLPDELPAETAASIW
jgi:hypothetical protein